MKLIILIVLSILFPVTHIGMSHGSLRKRLVEALGPWPFRGLYSLVTFATLGGAAAVYYGNGQLGPRLWELPRAISLAVALPLMAAALILFFLALATPSPAGMMPAKKDARGVLRITRHPMNMAFAAWALAHVVASGYLGDVVFFGSFVVTGIVGAFHQDRRMVKDRSESFKDFASQTSVLPFVAIVRRRTTLEIGELSFPMLIIAVAVFGALLWFHGQLFGIPIL